MNTFSALLPEHVFEFNASMWASLRARLVLPNGTRTSKQFPPLVKKGETQVNELWAGELRIVEGLNVPDGIIGT
jgi:hypothetical protein